MITFPISTFGAVQDPGTLKTNLVALWSCNDTSGGLVDSHASYDLDERASYSPTYSQSGQVGDSILMDGAFDYFRETTSSTNLTPSTNNSYSCWFYKNTGSDATTSALMSKYWSQTGLRVLNLALVGNAHPTVPNRVQYSTYDTNNLANNALYNAGGSDLFSGKWTFFVGTRAGTTNKLYVNGKLVATNTTGVSTMQTTTSASVPFIVGAQAKSTSIPDGLADGRIDQCGVWSKTLTQAEIDFLYNHGSGIAYSVWT